MKLNITAALTALLILISMSSASALSLISDCQYEEYRYNTSDAVFTAEVLGYEEVITRLDLGKSSHTLVEMQVQQIHKGNVSDTVTLYQQGALDAGEAMIPGLTLEWQEGDVYKVYTSETDEGYQLVCAGMGREIIKTQETILEEPITCRDMPAVAINPETQERVEFNSECNVPRGYTLLTRMAQPEITCSSLPVMALGPNGDRQQFESECDVPREWSILSRAQAGEPENCIQVISYAKNPETGDVHEYPTPCDIPEGWEKTDEPQPVTETPDESKPVRAGLFAKIANWFSNWF